MSVSNSSNSLEPLDQPDPTMEQVEEIYGIPRPHPIQADPIWRDRELHVRRATQDRPGLDHALSRAPDRQGSAAVAATHDRQAKDRPAAQQASPGFHEASDKRGPKLNDQPLPAASFWPIRRGLRSCPSPGGRAQHGAGEVHDPRLGVAVARASGAEYLFATSGGLRSPWAALAGSAAIRLATASAALHGLRCGLRDLA